MPRMSMLNVSRKALRTLLLSSAALFAATTASHAETAVLASIKPVHSLVAGVMQGINEPTIIVDGAASPHTYSLKPSQARALQSANVVFWVGHELEAFLEKPLETLAAKATTVELMDAHRLTRLKFREGGAFEEHDHDEHAGHDEHEEDHEEHAKAGEHHDDHDEDHEHGEFDPHVWLDPQNAKAFVHEIEEALSEADPENAVKYEANAQALTARLDELTAEIDEELSSVKDKPYVVFHDAYHYFESRFGLKAAGSITVSPEVIPGAERVAEIQSKLKSLGATCVFSEPQFEPRLISVVTEGTRARSGTLDPLGAEIENGPGLYFTLIRQMAKSLRDCLSANG